MTPECTKEVVELVQRKMNEHAVARLQEQPWYQEESRRIIALFEGREPDPPSEEYIKVYGEWTRHDRTSPRSHL